MSNDNQTDKQDDTSLYKVGFWIAVIIVAYLIWAGNNDSSNWVYQSPSNTDYQDYSSPYDDYDQPDFEDYWGVPRS